MTALTKIRIVLCVFIGVASYESSDGSLAYTALCVLLFIAAIMIVDYIEGED
jgi:hypothetical protein